MKETLKYQFLAIPGKMRGEIRLIIDERSVYQGSSDNGKTTSLTFFPFISLSITRPFETDDSGNRIRPQWNPSDTLSMTKFNLPVFLRELKSIIKDMTIPELYTYTGNRLELNDSTAEKIRKVFTIATTTVELSAVVVVQPDDSRVEGIKIKFNNEQSSLMLTFNEVTSLAYNLDHMNVDTVALQMYSKFCKTGEQKTLMNPVLASTKVDIPPVKSEFSDDDDVPY